MRLSILVNSAVCAAFLHVAALASGCATDAAPQPDLTVTEVWARATVANAPTSAGYFTITSQGSQDDTLLSATSPATGRIEIHRTIIEDDIARMRPAENITIAAGTTLKAEPGGLHLMLMDLQAPLVAGTPVPLTLSFRNAGALTVQMMPRDATDISQSPRQH